MAEQSKRSFPVRVKNALFENKLKLYSPVPDSKRPASLGISTFANNPCLTVYTNIEGDANKGTIRANVDTFTLMAVVSALADVLDTKPNTEGKYEVSYRIPAKRKKPGGGWGDLIVESWIHVARDPDGRVYLAITDGVATSIKFYFGPSDFHNEWQFNGKPIDGVKLGEIYANAWGRTLSEMVTQVLVINYEEPPQPTDYANKSGWKPAKPSDSVFSGSGFDDEIPF